LSDDKKLLMKTYRDRYRYFGAYPYSDPEYPLFEETHISTRYGVEGQFLWNSLWKNDVMLGFELQYQQADMKQRAEKDRRHSLSDCQLMQSRSKRRKSPSLPLLAEKLRCW